MLYIKEFMFMTLLGALILAGAADIFYDYTGGAALPHLVAETIVILASIAIMAALAMGIWRQSRSNQQLRHELATLEEQASAAKHSPAMVEARHGFARLIQQQFEEWGLTQTEKEVAMLLIKGLSFKEIAAVRQTLEKTVRQQASSIYRKAGVNGRHAFSAWFIEDFL